MPRKKSYQWDAARQDADDDAPSRSAKKRAGLALQDLGEELTKLSPSAWADLNLAPDLLEALKLYARIHDKEGRRRQMQFIGKLMREADPAPLRAALDARAFGKAGDTALFHSAELWRTRLLEAPEAEWEALADKLPPAQNPAAADELHALILAGRREAADNAPHARRALFRALHKRLSEAAEQSTP